VTNGHPRLSEFSLQKRGSLSSRLVRRREYDSPEYRLVRRRFARLVAGGEARCWRCGGAILPGSKWHTGHDDLDRSVIRGPEHPVCNLRAAGVKGARVVNRRRGRRVSVVL
jgi:hypothetical protein